MWLQDLLPDQIGVARIMAFAYDSADSGLTSLLSVEGITRAAEELLQVLIQIRNTAKASL